MLVDNFANNRQNWCVHLRSRRQRGWWWRWWLRWQRWWDNMDTIILCGLLAFTLSYKFRLAYEFGFGLFRVWVLYHTGPYSSQMLVHVILFLQAPAPCRWRRWCPWTTSGMPICRFVVERLSEWTESGQIISTQHVLIYGNPILTQRLLEHRPDYDEKVHAMPTRGWGKWHCGLTARNNVYKDVWNPIAIFTFTIKWYLQSVI